MGSFRAPLPYLSTMGTIYKQSEPLLENMH
jgi:hypothetical protein